MTRDLGRHVFGVAAICFGILTAYWQSVKTWPQIHAIVNAPYHELVIYAVGAAAVAAGIAIQSRRFAQLGAVLLGVLFLVFSAYWIPSIVKAPLVFGSWGNFFEQFSYVVGALMVYASFSKSPLWTARGFEIARILFGICVVSFALYQLFYLDVTANLVPKWIPPGQMFWAVATTVAFALAAVAILTGFQALLATRLLTAMLLLFGLLIWVPALFTNPGSHGNWAENTTNLAIAAVAWMLADYLGRTETAPVRRTLQSA